MKPVFMVNGLLVGVSLERVYFRFGLEASDVQFKLINIFRSVSLFVIRLVEIFDSAVDCLISKKWLWGRNDN